MMDEIQKVIFTKNEILISYSNYGSDGRNYGELFDFLGDNNIVTAFEIGQNVVLMANSVYSFSIQDEFILKRTGKISLIKECNLEDYIETDNTDHVSFIQWYL